MNENSLLVSVYNSLHAIEISRALKEYQLFYSIYLFSFCFEENAVLEILRKTASTMRVSFTMKPLELSRRFAQDIKLL